MVMQYPLAIPQMLRNNINYVFIFKEVNTNNRKRLYDQYASGIFPTFETFNQVFEQLTSDPFACMVINNTAKSNNIEDQVLWYKSYSEPTWQVMVDKKKKILDVVREELMQRTWHPRRVKQCLDYDELMDIFGDGY
jgi:hypothetical protein